MITLLKNPRAPQKAQTPGAVPAHAAPVVAQCCAKISRSVAGCHD